VKKWPNFFIVGSGKAGTSSLYNYLNDIPGIYMSPVKEPRYFSKQRNFPENHSVLNPTQGEEKYLRLFENVKDEKIIGEATPYLKNPKAPYLIFEKVPNASILITLRNPIEKVYSEYLMKKRNERISANFHEYVQTGLDDTNPKNRYGIFRGLYYDDVKRYLDVFGKDQVKIIIFEEWIKDPKPTLNEILKFLGLTGTSLDNFQNITHNPYREKAGPIAEYIRKNSLVLKTAQRFLSSSSCRSFSRKYLRGRIKEKPRMNEIDRQTLTKFFYDDVQKLKKHLGRELPWEEFKK